MKEFLFHLKLAQGHNYAKFKLDLKEDLENSKKILLEHDLTKDQRLIILKVMNKKLDFIKENAFTTTKEEHDKLLQEIKEIENLEKVKGLNKQKRNSRNI